MSKAIERERAEAWVALLKRYEDEIGGVCTFRKDNLSDFYYCTIMDNVNNEELEVGPGNIQQEIERRIKAYRSSKLLEKSLPMVEDKPKKQRL